VAPGTFYNNAGVNALQAPNADGRWIVYLQSPANLYNWAAPLNSGNDAIWNTPAGAPLAEDKTGNRYVFETAPTGQITLLNSSKVYGQNWTPILGRDYTIAAPNSTGAFTIASTDLDFSGVAISLASLGYDAKSPVGSYLVNFVSSVNANITLVPGSSASLTVTPATLTVGLTNVSKVYDGTTGAALGINNFSLSGLVNGDTVTLLNTPSAGVYATSDAGSSILVTASSPAKLGLSGSAATNYILRADGLSGYGTITPALLSASLTGSVSKVYDGTTSATLTKDNYLITGTVYKTDKVGLNNPTSGVYDNANAGTGKTVSVGGLAVDNANYQLVSTTIYGNIGTILPAPTTEPTQPLSAAQLIAAEPTVQTAVQSLTIRNNTTTASSGGSFGSAGPGSGGTGSGEESASSGESSSSTSGRETASAESSGESGSSSSSSESSKGSADSGSSTGSTAASSDSASSSGGSSMASSSSGSAAGGSTASSSGSTSQGAKAQAAVISRMNNPVAGAAEGGAEFQRLNPFAGGEGMHEEVASVPCAGGNAQVSTGRAAAVSVKSPEMTELAPMNDLNVLFMMF